MPTLFRVGMGKLSTRMATQNSVAMPPEHAPLAGPLRHLARPVGDEDIGPRPAKAC